MLKISTGVYLDAKAMVNALASPSAVFYTSDGTNATGFWAVWKNDLALQCGGIGSKIGVTQTTLVADFASAVLLSTPPTMMAGHNNA
jgi:hypothetical protein